MKNKFYQGIFCVATTKLKTHYQVLEVGPSASMGDIRKNYLRLAKIYHPDVYKNKDQTRFEKINQAYRILSDKMKRREYDMSVGLKVDEENIGREKQKNGQARSKMESVYENEEKDINIDEQYQKFFSQRSKTKFEEIRLSDDPEFRSMNEAERVRRYFSNFYQEDQAIKRSQYQKQFASIMDEQINQKNRSFEDVKEKSQKYDEMNSRKGLNKMTMKVIFVFIAFTAISFPFIYSILTKYKLEEEERQKMELKWKEMNQEADEMELRSRFKY